MYLVYLYQLLSLNNILLWRKIFPCKIHEDQYTLAMRGDEVNEKFKVSGNSEFILASFRLLNICLYLVITCVNNF